ncbi:MAG: hypothetical protein MMC33_000553 [Icmadophila ericetorum]|nr:hypothetical protein [Icmadophila ericetorum]
MPSFYPSTLPRQMPLTPPEHYGVYPLGAPSAIPSSNIPYLSHKVSDGQYVFDTRSKFGLANKENYTMPTHSAYGKENWDRQVNQTYLPPANTLEPAYRHVGAPMLPPIRVADSMEDENTYYSNGQAVRPQVHQPKEEKQPSVGGVAAHLDYEMDQMVDFVSEMAQKMYDLFHSPICVADIDMIRSVHPTTPVTPAFRKYVSQILSSTRLPSSTILLGLHYLTTRMNMLSADGNYGLRSTHQMYQLLTIALLLGSKFLDDNTFQNRSWSEVSSIPVAELNVLEIDWLLDIKWTMHIDPHDHQGFSAWLSQWNRWQQRKVERTLDSLKLTPLDTNIQRQRSVNKQLPPTPSMFAPSYSDSVFNFNVKDRSQGHWQATPRYDQWPPLRSMIDRSPPSAPETGPNTPEWYGRQGSIGYNPAPLAYSLQSLPPPLQVLPSTNHQSAPYFTPYPQQYNHNVWGSHGMGCGCGCNNNAPFYERYSMAGSYSHAQSVAG